MSGKKGVPGGVPYPVQSQGMYPSAPPAYSVQGPPQPGAQGGPWNEPPPPYSAAPGYPPPVGYPPQGGAHPGQGAYPAQAAFQLAPGMIPVGPGSQVHVMGAFNAGARFDARTRPSIPPPPPGVAPNVAQLAAMSGANVVASKKKNDKWGMGAGGGAVFW
ncbi:DAZ-associated protein 2-like isoform X2 [Amphibalanus amphitrite]|nr:DAZ-associated protein 2-like isoform X2 [Amphibalanus amphitrite]XP_043241143.1 DAZ-associated protein 2-like isoform X2 [Amphibalanus amphitrite]XP_043241144.1 DAZ-associated protein 2-like isoform X2 [Amphibalanus amphitrite]XP_043241145.1 DAZ-associated protein 2-like isoform X2 [Amphibalanus amphitrite]XP_043241146.1 DAZ-associated protein 2-like isoform X2 [Amphibalanus amphitrite]XP_043241147.1 DAZ-associated protein 2-like isoform X2 [Amphibalanus amphitrite]XP_043241148.1 DAZ-asso